MIDLSKFFEELEQLEEARYVVRRVTIGFPKEIGNYADAHSSLPIFGNAWGRGVLFQQGNEYIAIVAGGGSSHAQIKQRSGGLSVVKTFYFGYANDTLYLEHATVAANKDFNRSMIIEIAAAISESGPLRGTVYKFN
jgi:hypothetical protein